MDLYTAVSSEMSRMLTRRYSSSFSSASSLFPPHVQTHIYNIYGLVRVADEVVDTYTGTDAAVLLKDLEAETYAAIARGFSANPVVHSFAITARQHAIGKSLIAAFFASMHMDTKPQVYTKKTYEKYIYGSAEVVGLMCLKVFVEGNTEQYESLKDGAKRLGAAYQKVNFLRDVADDYSRLGRLYFPGVSFGSFDEQAKHAIIDDCEADFQAALPSVRQLPASARLAVMTSYRYYHELLMRLKVTPAEVIKVSRISVSKSKKLTLLATAKLSSLT